MIIHFSNVNFNSRSGPNSFAYRLGRELTRRGHKITGNPEECEVFLAFIEAASRPPAHAKFIQRLDGIWFKPDEFITHNVGIKWTYDNAEQVIWQSNFDRNMSEHHWGKRSGRVIRNGIDVKPQPVSNYPLSHIKGRKFVCSANWHNQKRLTENLLLFRQVQEEDDVLLIMGSNATSPLGFRSNEIVLGNIDHASCLEIYNQADWFIHLAWLDHCPNVVVEALSQGCPVICTTAGGTDELVRDRGIIVPETEYKFELVDYDNPPKLDLSNFELRDIPSFDTTDLEIGTVADQYEEMFVR